MSPADRLLAFEGIENFRDYGGYPGRDGARLARGRLFRSAHHASASEADLQRLQALGVNTIVDLRRRAERLAQPSRRPPAFQGRVIENDTGDTTDPPHVAFLRSTDLTPQSVDAFMRDHYRHSPFEPRHLDLFRRYFEALATTDAPVLIHCAAGKDRTGLLAALTHHLAGVSREDLIADYLLTNDAARIERRLPEVTAHIAETYGRTPSEAAVRAFLGVEPHYLATALDAITARYGSLDAYLEQALGVDAARRAAILARLLV